MAQVLVADDDDTVRELLRLNLEIDGHQVVAEASDGRAAIEALHRLRPQVLVLDMMMPGTSGADVLRELGGRTRQPCLCIIAYSASSAHLQLAGELGADATVLKSGDMEPVLAAVAGCSRAA